MWLCNYPVYNHTISSTNWWFKPATITVLFLKWWVSVCHFFYMYNWEFCMANFPFFPIYLHSYIWIFIFILWIIIHYSHCSDCLQFGHWELLKSPPLLFDTLPWFFWTFPSGTQDLSGTSHTSSAPHSEASSFSRGALVPFIGV